MNHVPSALLPRLMLSLSLVGAAAPSAFCSTAHAPLRVNVGRFSGNDSRLTAAVSETLVTDMAKSGRLALLDRRGYSSRGPSSPFTLTGSCLLFDDSVVINARLVDSMTGRTIPGGAANVDGPRGQVFLLVHGLATRLVQRLTGAPPIGRSAHYGSGHGPLVPSVRVRPPLVVKPPIIGSDDEEAGVEFPGEHGPTQVGQPGDGDVRPSRRYSSVIIDARGLQLERSMSPKIRREDGSTVWAGAEATPDFVLEDGIVAYAKTMEEARSMARAGSRPLVLEALDRYDTPFPSDPILADKDAEFLMEAASRAGFLKKFRVIFVIER